jgi:hypothetical protein
MATNVIFAVAGSCYVAGSFMIEKKEEVEAVGELKEED